MGQHRQLVTWDNTAEQRIKSLFVRGNSQNFNSPRNNEHNKIVQTFFSSNTPPLSSVFSVKVVWKQMYY